MPTQWAITQAELFQDWQIENTVAANPVLATSTPLVYAPDHITMGVEGPAYAGWMLKHGFPCLALSSGIITSTTDFWPTLDALDAQVWEDDTRVTDGNGNVWIADSQLNLDAGGVLEVANPDGATWFATTFKVSPPPAGQWATLQRVFKFGAGVCSIVSASAWGQSWTAPAGMPEVPLLPLGWTGPPQVVKQLQLGENALGQPFSLSFRNVNVSCVGSV